jgi:organic hydroperoxide reductase OsmC/OhrA
MSHHYAATVRWTGNLGEGTKGYRSYSRDYDVIIEGRPTLAGSSDEAFRGDASRHNPEDLLLAAISACHMLWYLHLCAVAGIVVTAYEDQAEAEMAMNADGSGQFTTATLRPVVTIASSEVELAKALHHEANQKCFIARSLNFSVHHEVTIITASAG